MVLKKIGSIPIFLFLKGKKEFCMHRSIPIDVETYENMQRLAFQAIDGG